MASVVSKRAKMDIDENKNDILLDEIVVKIIQNVPISQWSQLELVSKQFQRCTENAYRATKTINLKDVFLLEFGRNLKQRDELFFNQFLPKLVHSCPLLQSISGFGCLFTKNISSNHLELLQNLKELKNATFEKWTINISDFSRFLKNFPRMQVLHIDDCRFVHESFPPVEPHTDVPCIENDNEYFDFFGNFYGLIELAITGLQSRFAGSFLQTINVEMLNVLNFRNTKFHGTFVISLLNRCVNLEVLYLHDPTTCIPIHGVGLELEVLQCLPNLPKLRKFDLNIDDQCIMYQEYSMEYNAADLLNVLVKCKNLRHIRLVAEYVAIVTDGFLDRLIAECPLLEDVNFDVKYCNSEEVVAKLANLQNLTHLRLSNCEKSDVLKKLCSNLHKLKKLSSLTIYAKLKMPQLVLLKNCKNLTSFTCGGVVTKPLVSVWAKNGFFQKMTSLEIYSAVSSEVVKAVCEKVPHLNHISFRGGVINDEALLCIAEKCKLLKTLDIVYCKGISVCGLLCLLSHCDSLTCLTVSSDFHAVVTANIFFKPYKNILRIDSCDDFYDEFFN